MTESNGSLMMVRLIKAPLNEVFNAWTDAKLFARWMSHGAYVAKTTEFDVRIGGKYRVEVKGPESDEPHVTTGEYLEIVPNRLIVKTWIYSGPLKRFESTVTRLTVEFRETKPNCTELTLKHEALPTAQYSEAVGKGWTGCLDQLEALLANGVSIPAARQERRTA
jgi:uncharacterized protein YndB with AHSA1/START domain